MRSASVAIVTTVLAAALLATRSDAGDASRSKTILSIEAVLVDANGLHPLTGTTDGGRVELRFGGARHQIIELESDRSDLLVYKLSFAPMSGDRIKLTLERTRVRRGAKEEVLPQQEAVISVLDAWTTTLLDDTARKRRVVLRVLPELRVPVEDEPLEEHRFLMQLEGGPLVRYGRSREEDRIVFRAVNSDGSGMEFGVPGFGVIRLHLRPFPGATRVGWIRGRTMSFTVDGQEFQAWSLKEILPEDPARPGKGWVLYGALSPASEARFPDGYYGSFQPGN